MKLNGLLTCSWSFSCNLLPTSHKLPFSGTFYSGRTRNCQSSLYRGLGSRCKLYKYISTLLPSFWFDYVNLLLSSWFAIFPRYAFLKKNFGVNCSREYTDTCWSTALFIKRGKGDNRIILFIWPKFRWKWWNKLQGSLSELPCRSQEKRKVSFKITVQV